MKMKEASPSINKRRRHLKESQIYYFHKLSFKRVVRSARLMVVTSQVAALIFATLILVQASAPIKAPSVVIKALTSNSSQVANNYSTILQQQNLNRNTTSGQQQQQQESTAKQTNERINLIEADHNGLYLVGLFDIHQSNPRVPFKCGSIDVDVGEWHSRRPMQNMEAFLWAIEQVNADKSLLPGVRLGSLVMDTCSSFLRTNQQLANLLHGTGAGAATTSHTHGKQVTSVRQIVAIVADQADWQSVEATVSMASAQGLTTFVSQSRSSKLSELARKYKPSQGSQNQDQLNLNSNLQLALAGQPDSLGRRSAASDSGPLAPPLDGLLSELLGLGKMTSSRPSLGSADNSSTWWGWPEEQQQRLQQQQVDQQQQQQQQEKLYMVRMLLGNELLADAIGSLVQQMNWDLISVIYDDDPDLVDLHDELIKQLFSRNIQLALDEQIPTHASTESYDKLLQNLAKKSTYGARVVITLLGTGSARLLLDSLHHLRNSPSISQSSSGGDLELVNSLLWISVTDREPYYSFATDALGTIAISSSVSLIPEFRSYYDKLANEQHATVNRWWPEYMRAILLKHQKDIELVSNECARWQEPKVSPLNEKCRSLTLSSLVQFEKSANYSGISNKSRLPNAMNMAAAAATSGISNGQQQQQAKLAKYLANGWEHNGMDIINSVLAAANGLESIRQTLCPNQQVGICDRMRELISGGSGAAAAAVAANKDKLPILSELIYNELLRSTFQLADGRMFNLDDFNLPSGQVEGKFKLYNLRYLQQNSIGFVKFGSFDQVDGLEMNISKARHYPRANSYLEQEPIELVKSTCEDENKCLMFGTLGALNKQHQQAGGGLVSEEELAAGVNSLFKLDHPGLLQPPASASAGGETTAGTDGDVSGRLQQQQQTASSQARPVEDDLQQVHTMRSPPAMSRFNWSSVESQQVAANGVERQPMFNTIVLLPLHKGYQSSSSSSTGIHCSGRLDMEHSFQLLAALAYAQQSVNGHWPAASLPHQHLGSSRSNSRGNNDDNNNANVGGVSAARPQIELTTTVIDYCDQLELAKTKLLAKLDYSTNSTDLKQSNKQRLPAGGKPVLVIDFDAQISENIDNLLEERQLLHLTISPNSLFNHQLQQQGKQNMVKLKTKIDVSSSSSKQATKSKHNNHLKLSLMPSKSNEIQALVKLISSMPQWKLVHLIYTDHHHYRDEFVRQANEANICVSKLIWIPATTTIAARTGTENSELNNGVNKELASHYTAANFKTDNAASTGGGGGGSTGAGGTEGEWQSEQMVQLEKTRALFARELHDYSIMMNRTTTTTTKTSKQEMPSDPSGAQGLNATRVLVVLASSNEDTNRMILEAASDSMLEDYVWVTSHEWLSSVELPAAATSGSVISTKLPRFYLSTRLETYESHNFRHYLSSLTPAIHSPLPSSWFDEFWQQHFRCRLPIPNARATGGSAPQDPICRQHQHLDTQQMLEDDRVHYVIEAMECLHEALVSSNSRNKTGGSSELAQEFRRSLERRRQLGVSGAHQSILAHLPYGFHIVHRLLPSSSSSSSSSFLQARDHSLTANGTLRRRANSRDLSNADQGQLLRVGLWRDGQLILLKQKQSTGNNNNTLESSSDHRWWLNSRAATDVDSNGMDQETASSISRSLARLGGIKSRCSSSQTCGLCRQQVEQTMSIIRQEAARLGQSESVAEPSAISSIWMHRQQPAASILNSVPNHITRFDDDLQTGSDQGDDDDDADNEDKRSDDNQVAQDGGRDIQAAASSLFDGVTSKQVADRQREFEMRRLYGSQMGTKLQQQQQGRWIDSLQSSSFNMRHAPALISSMFSLVGVLIIVASMTYFYPNMLERASRRTIPDESNGFCLAGVVPTTKTSAGMPTTIPHTLNNINDYFLLTGLLMLYSINMAFLLPATMGLCWFRRIGLATSYTVIFSSILVKVLNSCRQSSRQQQAQQGQQYHQHPSAQQPITNKKVDPVEDVVEVTFESLTQDQNLTTMSVEEDQQQTTHCSTINHLTNGYQTSTERQPQHQQHHLMVDGKSLSEENIWNSHWYNSRDPATLLTISICLILCQLVVSLVWFIQQPPEPTLYFACWRCASPIRSPILFLYEPLLSLLYPGLILVLAWCLSIIAYRVASQNEEQYRLASERLMNHEGALYFNQAIMNNTHIHNDNHHHQLKFKQRQLDHKLRDAKSLVMATTLIVFVWSILTLNMISSSHKLMMPPPNSIQMQQANAANQDQSNTNTLNDLSLVYANIISGAIIFLFLFIYRLHLIIRPSFGGCLFFWRWRRRSRSSSKVDHLNVTRGGGQRNHVLKFNGTTHSRSNQQLLTDNKWFGSEDIYPIPMGDSFFTGSQFSTAPTGGQGGRGHERLKLQQFNSSYGTYSASAAAAAAATAVADGDNYHTSTTINPLHTIHSNSAALNAEQSRKGGSLKRRQKAPSASLFFNSAFGGSSSKKRRKPPVPKPRIINGASTIMNSSSGGTEFKLQRRQSSGSVASSTAKLVGDNSSMDNDMFMDDDTISCASSVASSSTSQLHGNDLYPIDCSIQLDSQMPNTNSFIGPTSSTNHHQEATTAAASTLPINRSNSLNRRSSLRRSMTQAGNKLSSVREEPQANACSDSLDGGSTVATITDK